MRQSDWPTLGQLINNGTRVVVFLDSGADVTSVPFILPEFQMVGGLPVIEAMRNIADSVHADLGNAILCHRRQFPLLSRQD